MAIRKTGTGMLQKKLQEVESKLEGLIRLPPEPSPSDPHLQLASDDIGQGIIFLRNLFQRETASQPQNSTQLLVIGRRLTTLEAKFRGWNEWRLSSVCSDCRTQTILQGDDAREAGSVVSENSPENLPCGESSMKKGGGQMVSFDGVDGSQHDSNSDGDDFSGEKTPETAAGGDKAWGKMGNHGCAFGCGVIFGAVSMQILVFVCYNYLKESEALVPPT